MSDSRSLAIVTATVALIFTKVSCLLVDPFDLVCGGDINPLEITLDSSLPSCGSGWSDYGVGCIQNCKSGYSTWDQLSCSANCRSGYTEIGHTCNKVKMCGPIPCGYDVYFRDTYVRAHKIKNICPDGKSILDGNCFGSCPDGYSMDDIDIMNGEFGICQCDDLFVLLKMGDVLLSGQNALVSVGTSCMTELVSSISENGIFDTIISESQMNNPENVWSPVEDALDTFGSCMDAYSTLFDTLLSRRRMVNSDEHIWSLEFGTTATAVVGGSLSIGILFNPPDERKYYATACAGITTNIEADVFSALVYNKDMDSIEGTSYYESWELDVEVVGFTFTYDEDMENFSIGFSIGPQVFPFSYGGGVCTTTWIL